MGFITTVVSDQLISMQVFYIYTHMYYLDSFPQKCKLKKIFSTYFRGQFNPAPLNKITQIGLYTKTKRVYM